jgi:hypothetical protein
VFLDYEKNLVDILAGKVGMASSEDRIGDRVYRTRLVADLEHVADCGGQPPAVVGVLGLSIDVTDMKARASLEVDNTRLMMEERAAKDSNRIKSQFLANVSMAYIRRLGADSCSDEPRNADTNSCKVCKPSFKIKS